MVKEIFHAISMFPSVMIYSLQRFRYLYELCDSHLYGTGVKSLEGAASNKDNHFVQNSTRF